ncbi:MAG: phosphoribosylanthranilate isomerase [Nonlabens sp.]
MIIKICGMRDVENIDQLQQLDFDFMGLIRYPKSKRFVDDNVVGKLENYSYNKGTVGVYVNAQLEQILQDFIPLQLDIVQLHGDEDPAFAKALLELDIKIFKAFQITQGFDFNGLDPWITLGKEYKGKLFFLFDTATVDYGGSGKKFDWTLLDQYCGEIPFMLSGGISREDAAAIKQIKHKQLLGVDINSRFETDPGVKDIDAISEFLKKMGR